MPEYLGQAADNEDTAHDLQGMLFEDKDIGWCEVTGWYVDHGTNVIQYTPVGQIGLFDAEFHTSSAEILSVVRHIPTTPKISDYKLSRKVVLITKQPAQNVRRALSATRKRLMYGTMVSRKDNDSVAGVKVLSSKVIIKILKAQESMFKYGTFIPKSDREAEQNS